MKSMKKSIIALLIASQLLTSCVPVALVVGAAAGGVVVYDRRSIKQAYIDQEITRHCLYALNNLHGKSHISVVTQYQVVLLVGQVETPALKAEASQVLANIPNIKRLYNELTVAGPTSLMTRSSDTWLTAKVKAAMLREHDLKSSQIKVITEDGVVYLTGRISRDQGDLAARVARRVNGVKMVVKVFEYTATPTQNNNQ